MELRDDRAHQAIPPRQILRNVSAIRRSVSASIFAADRIRSRINERQVRTNCKEKSLSLQESPRCKILPGQHTGCGQITVDRLTSCTRYSLVLVLCDGACDSVCPMLPLPNRNPVIFEHAVLARRTGPCSKHNGFVLCKCRIATGAHQPRHPAEIVIDAIEIEQREHDIPDQNAYGQGPQFAIRRNHRNQRRQQHDGTQHQSHNPYSRHAIVVPHFVFVLFQ